MKAIVHRCGFAAICLVFAAGAFAQTRPPSGNPSGGTPTRPTQPTVAPQQQQQQQIQRPIFIMGDVVTGDGTPVPRNIEIHRVCNGRDRREGYADSTGHFSFQLGAEATIQDASSDDFSGPGMPAMGNAGSAMGMGGNMMSQSSSMSSGSPVLFGCELKAVSPGFRSSTLELSTFRAEEPIVGKLVLERYEHVQGTMVSATGASAPKDAQKAYKKGIDFLKKGKFDEAQEAFTQATTIYPRYADAWMDAGRIYLRKNDEAAARNAFKQAITADPKFVAPYVSLASIEAMHQNWTEAAKLSDTAITLDPIDFPTGYFYNSVANFNMGHMDVAERTARKAATLDSQHRLPQIQSLLGRILLLKKDYPGALENFRAYLKSQPNAPDGEEVRRQVQTLEQASAASPAAAAPAPPRQ